MSVRKFAEILATAPNLSNCNIKGQKGNKKIKVEIKYATMMRKGAIVIKDQKTNQELYRCDTKKQESDNRMRII